MQRRSASAPPDTFADCGPWASLSSCWATHLDSSAMRFSNGFARGWEVANAQRRSVPQSAKQAPRGHQISEQRCQSRVLAKRVDLVEGGAAKTLPGQCDARAHPASGLG